MKDFELNFFPDKYDKSQVDKLKEEIESYKELFVLRHFSRFEISCKNIGETAKTIFKKHPKQRC